MKKFFLLIAVVLTATTTFAQEKALKQSKFGDNWFMQGQLGASYTWSEGINNLSFGNRLSPHVALSLGKYFAPAMGARLQLGGWESNNYTCKTSDSKYKINYLQTNIDGLLNLTNLFMPYDADRTFNFITFLGVGYVHGFKNSDRNIDKTNSLIPRAGIQADFRLNDDLSLNLEVAGNLMNDNFNGNVTGKKYDATVNTMLGFTYHFTKGGFKTVDIIDPSQIKALNDKINEQRELLDNKDGEISRLKTDLANKPEPVTVITKEVREQTEVLMNAVVVFRLGSAQLEKNQDINIFNAARYLKDNPQVKVTVTGYADKSTGNPTVNQKLSEKRAEAVAKVLIDKYGIAPSRITTKASGDKEQLFPTDEWNRVVVFTATSM